jgi:hypothetical protein
MLSLVATGCAANGPPPPRGHDAEARPYCAPSDASPAWSSCAAIVEGADPRFADDLRALCAAHDVGGGRHGVAGTPVAEREVVECLVQHDLDDETWRALARVDNPATRSYAREVLHRHAAWTPALRREAEHDDACVHVAFAGCELGEWPASAWRSSRWAMATHRLRDRPKCPR